MRTQKTIKNIKYVMIGQFIYILLHFVVRKLLTQSFGPTYLGLNGFFTNIISVLSVAELGIGSALVFSLYAPLAKNDEQQVKRIMHIYKLSYYSIGIIIFVAGCAFMPFIRFFLNDAPTDINIYLVYLIFLITSAETYFFSYKISLLVADQKKYIAMKYEYGFFFVLNIIQIIVLLLYKNYLLFIGVKLVIVLLENIFSAMRSTREYPYLKEKPDGPLDADTKNEIVTNIKAMFVHRISGVVVSGTDNLLLSLISLIAVGLYSNYLLITTTLNTIISHIYAAIMSSVGNLYITESKEKSHEIFNVVFMIGSWLNGFICISLICLLNPFILIVFGSEYLFTMPIVLSIVISFYLMAMRNPTNTFRQAFGFYSQKIYIPILEAVINLVASIIFIKIYGVVGVFIGTILSTLCTCFWFEPWLVYKLGFKMSLVLFWKKYIKYTLITVLTGVVTYYICTLLPMNFLGFVFKCFVCLIIPNIVFMLILKGTQEFIYFKNLLISMIEKRNIKK